jgi:hypothetical protein
MFRADKRKVYGKLLVLGVLVAALFLFTREQTVYADSCDTSFTSCRASCPSTPPDAGSCADACQTSYVSCAQAAAGTGGGPYQPIQGDSPSCRAADVGYRYCLRGGYAGRADFQACIDGGLDRESCCSQIVYAEHPECY